MVGLAATLTLASSAFADTSFGEDVLSGTQPYGVAVSRKSSDVYVVDQGQQRVDRFNSTGVFLGAFGWGVLDGASELQACTAATGCRNGLEGSGAGQLSFANGIAVDNDPGSPSYGEVWVAEFNNKRVQKFSSTGAFELMVGGEVDKTTHANICISGGDTCGVGVAGAGAGQFGWFSGGNATVATGPGGDLYVGDEGRVEKFAPSGSYLEDLVLGTGPIEALAVDSVGSMYIDHGDGSGVQKYNSSGVLQYTVDNLGQPIALATDLSNNLFIAETTNGEEYEFRGYNSVGTLYAFFSSPEVPARIPAHYGLKGIAVGDSSERLYASTGSPITHVAAMALPFPGPPLLSAQRVTDIRPNIATLRAVVNPAEFDTKYRFQYVTQEHFEAEGFENPEQATPTEPNLGSLYRGYPVQVAISPLTPGNVYHYRVVAESKCEPSSPGHVCFAEGSNETFETLPAISVHDFTTQAVGPELVQFKAELDNNNSLQEGHYTVCYGDEKDHYVDGCAEGTLDPGSGAFEAREAIFSGLQPNTSYHYQLVAHNEYGEVKTPDATFTTELSGAEEREAEACPNGTPNSTLREQNNSLALPDCRAYEQTTEVNKEGSEAFGRFSLAPGGQRVLYQSQGVFAGALVNELTISYLTQRTSVGWVTQPAVGRPGPVGVEPLMEAGALFFSPELDRWLFAEIPGFSHGEAQERIKSAYLSMGFADSSFLLQASPALNLLEGPTRAFLQFLGISNTMNSDDLSHLYLAGGTRFLSAPEDPRQDEFIEGTASDNRTRIYELSGVGTSRSAIRLVAEVPPGLNTHKEPTCSIDTDTHGDTFQHAAERLVSADGSTLVYTAPIEVEAGKPCGNGEPNPIGFFAHNGSTTVQLNAKSAAQCHSPAPCSTATPTKPTADGISPDGTRAWFSTTQPLIDSDTDQTRDLYMAKLSGGEVTELVEASTGEATPAHPQPGQGAGVLGVLQVSGDGSHVAFAASGVLTADPNPSTGESAAQGADNLYVYDSSSGATAFVSRLCSGSKESGSVVDPNCPASGVDAKLWRREQYGTAQAKFTPTGGVLIFPSSGRLTADDTDSVADLYRYDFASGQLLRVSFGRNGNDANGNDDDYPIEVPGPGENQIGSANELGEDSTRVISSDGSKIIIETAAPLVSRDANGATDIYEWEQAGHGSCHESGGCIFLISDGVDPHGARGAVISSSGRDIAFHTRRGEVPGDTDGVGDVYDAREDGGFHYSPPQPPCEKENCRPAAKAPPSSPVIGSEENRHGPEGESRLRCGKGKHREKRHGEVRCVPNKSHQKHRHKRRSSSRSAKTSRGGKK